MSDGVKTTLILTVKPGTGDQFCKTFAAMVPDTRVYPGCRSVTAYRNLDEPDQFVLIGEWDSKEAYQKYLAWRAANSKASATDNPMAAPPRVDFWSRIEG